MLKRNSAPDNPTAPRSGISAVRLASTAKGNSRAAASTASRAISRYVVYFPPATLISPGALRRTACSRDNPCLLYTSDAADDLLCVDLGGRRIIKKKKKQKKQKH